MEPPKLYPHSIATFRGYYPVALRKYERSMGKVAAANFFGTHSGGARNVSKDGNFTRAQNALSGQTLQGL
eukprot:3802432-Amphidinium_carterae.1